MFLKVVVRPTIAHSNGVWPSTGSFTSLILDRAKVMGFDQTEIARTKRAENAAAEAKVTRYNEG
jgi:hypothetical protein